jgi:hypothetical protein
MAQLISVPVDKNATMSLLCTLNTIKKHKSYNIIVRLVLLSLVVLTIRSDVWPSGDLNTYVIWAVRLFVRQFIRWFVRWVRIHL